MILWSTLKARVIKQDMTRDLAFKIDQPLPQVKVLRHKVVIDVGEEVHAIGHLMGNMVYTKGYVKGADYEWSYKITLHQASVYQTPTQ